MAAASMVLRLRVSSSRWMSAIVFFEEVLAETLAVVPLAAAGCFHGLPVTEVLTGEPVPQVLVAGRPTIAVAAFSRSRRAAASCSRAARRKAMAASSFFAAFLASASWISLRLGPLWDSVPGWGAHGAAGGGARA